ncbi:MAG: YggS family pyridoxal phosphate-dependent enzyme [Gemmatimonas sp.]|nr:YggS family pyridoxal phosphate-dependent enzyme [Gemmatimonas sp.]
MTYLSVSSRVAAVRERIAAACQRSGRSPSEVTIVAVTKTHPADAVEAVRAAGLTDVGENRIQELEGKVSTIGRQAVRWHLIGHLQRNKAKKALELADMIHSVDSVRLARKLSDEAAASDRVIDVLVQVSVSGEETKGGLVEEGAIDGIAEICSFPGLRVSGLMTMAPYTDDESLIRTTFRATRQLLDRAASVDGFEGRHLSMGMSNDFEVGIEEGSTIVRLGTVLFGERGA